MTQNLTFDKLVEQVLSYAVRKDAAFIAQVPTFIMLAENRLATDMKQQGFQAVVTGTLPTTPEMPKPQWWRETLSFTYEVDGVVQPLSLRTLEYVKNYWPAPFQKSAPRFYADYNINNFYLAATPDVPYDFELTYYARLEPLSAEHQENWLTMNAPQALFLACLGVGAVGVRYEGEIAKWTVQYAGASGGQMKENSERVVDRNTVVR